MLDDMICEASMSALKGSLEGCQRLWLRLMGKWRGVVSSAVVGSDRIPDSTCGVLARVVDDGLGEMET
jgi:hypothetical protein